MANLRTFETQLTNFLLNKIKNKDELQLAVRRYGNLRITMNHAKYDRPHFIIKIGISEAAFDIDSGAQIGGGLGQESNNVKMWITRFLHKSEIKAVWKTESLEYKQKIELENQIAERVKKK